MSLILLSLQWSTAIRHLQLSRLICSNGLLFFVVFCSFLSRLICSDGLLLFYFLAAFFLVDLQWWVVVFFGLWISGLHVACSWVQQHHIVGHRKHSHKHEEFSTQKRDNDRDPQVLLRFQQCHLQSCLCRNLPQLEPGVSPSTGCSWNQLCTICLLPPSFSSSPWHNWVILSVSNRYN